MSPEQATGDRDVDPRSDVYALGCVLYEMLAGQPPFSATTAQAVLVKVLTMDAPSITSELRTVPPHVGHALAKTLEKLPADRFTSAAEFATALRDESFTYRARTSVIATPVVQFPREKTRPWNRLTIAMATLAAVLTLGWLLLRPALSEARD
jgi:serine/threonine protein kinase